MIAGTKIICPHCRATLKSGKTLPVGKRITCVKCKQAFTFTEAMAGGDADDTSALMLAETQAGTMKSPIAGMNLAGLPDEAAEEERPTAKPRKAKKESF